MGSGLRRSPLIYHLPWPTLRQTCSWQANSQTVHRPPTSDQPRELRAQLCALSSINVVIIQICRIRIPPGIPSFDKLPRRFLDTLYLSTISFRVSQEGKKNLHLESSAWCFLFLLTLGLSTLCNVRPPVKNINHLVNALLPNLSFVDAFITIF